MSGPFTGMDIDAVRYLSQSMLARAERIRALMHEMTSQLNGTQWVGLDRQNFESDWQSQHCAALNNVLSGLEEAARRAQRNANEQEAVSRG